MRKVIFDPRTNNIENWQQELGAANPNVHVCESCNKTFLDNGSLITHQRRIHQIYTPVFLRVEDSTCPFCLRDFFTIARARKHFRSAPKCHAQLIQLPELSEEILAKIKEDDVVNRKDCKNLGGYEEHKALLTYVQRSGPRPRECFL